MITNSGENAIHICSVFVVNAGAQSDTLAEGTGSNCGTGTTYVIGGSGGTASFAANGGFLWGPSSTVTIPMQKRGDNWCLVLSSTSNASGLITYGVFP